MTLHEAKKLAEKTNAENVCFQIDVWIRGMVKTEYSVWDGKEHYYGASLEEAMGKFLAANPIPGTEPDPQPAEGFFAEAAA